MSYIALARKWRPKKFSELVGQTHVSQALSNALAQNRLHHAYLFTGTRGVGKTTIARIFSKALNCEQGVTPEPCGVCEACRAVDEGRFVDLIEVDAASRTKVEDTREILDNVQYAPTQGRYKVYLIDEVHMLSKSSFNALLKTLEEPPEHVKFLLATTDPHKLPATVLSRCLQFNLMRLTPVQIQNHLETILTTEKIPFEPAALHWIAKSAEGSARDSLSLLDQAIAYGAGEVKTAQVQAMLGLVDQNYIEEILQTLISQDADQIKAIMRKLSTAGVDYEALLNALTGSLYELSQYQILGSFVQPSEQEIFLKSISVSIAPELVQMYYQICLLAKQDLQWAPDPRIGFEMLLLRLIAFQLPERPLSTSGEGTAVLTKQAASPQASAPTSGSLQKPSVETVPSARAMLNKSTAEQEGAPPAKPIESREAPSSIEGTPPLSHVEQMAARLAQQAGQGQGGHAKQASVQPMISNQVEAPSEHQGLYNEPSPQEAGFAPMEAPSLGKFEAPAERQVMHLGMDEAQVSQPPLAEKEIEALSTFPDENALEKEVSQSVLKPPAETSLLAQKAPEIDILASPKSYNWLTLLDQVPLEGMAAELAKQCEWVALDEIQRKVRLRLDPNEQTAKTDLAEQRLLEAVQAQWGKDYQLEIVCEPLEGVTPAQWVAQQTQNQKEKAKRAFQTDPFVQQFQQYFGAKMIESAIKPRG